MTRLADDKEKRTPYDYVPNCPWAAWPLTLDPSALYLAELIAVTLHSAVNLKAWAFFLHQSRNHQVGVQLMYRFNQRSHVPESWRQAQEEMWELVLTCCWPKQSWSCSCCCSFSLCSLRPSASLIFLFSWKASCWCPLIVCFKSSTSPSSAATCARKKEKVGENFVVQIT